MRKEIGKKVWWVGKTDWELKKFHGEEYSTHKGSSYNSYLVEGESKTILIDTVWKPFAKEFVDNLEKEFGLENIDAIIQNHAEVDHSGALPELLKRRPNLPIYCTANGVKSLTGHYHENWDFHVVKTGDKLDIGGREFVFIEAPMLHWPDSMFSYLTGDAILFSNDAFGQHLATERLFDDEVNHDELFAECIKYYANILTPFSPLVKKKIEQFVGLNLPLSTIATSHGVIWRKDPMSIVTKYMEWCQDYQTNQITILYDSMWDATRRIAEAISRGITEKAPATTVKLFKVSQADKNDVITEVFKSKAILLGSSTINRGILSSAAMIMEEIKGLAFKNKKAASFGSYGWSGEGNTILDKLLGESGFTLTGPGLKVLWNPNDEAIKEAEEFGKNFARGL
ncbi:anaerobic nitric oxide reductase flavorubredoxin [Treponema sp.]